MASGAALVTGFVLPARTPPANHVHSRTRGCRSLLFHHNRARTYLPCSDTRRLFGCAPDRGHLKVARAEGSTCLFIFSVAGGGWSLNTHVCVAKFQ
jgi:hypothetical protein